MEIRKKTSKDENFPVASFFLPADKRQIIMEYYRFARYADDIADNPQTKPQTKIKKLHELEDVYLQTKAYKGQTLSFAPKLRQELQKQNLPLTLASDLLIAFRQDALGFEYQTWGQLVEYCKYSAAPVGHFMLALFGESKSARLPATSLCVALQIVNHLQDIKYDASVLNRIYLPSDFMKKYGVSRQDLCADKTSAGLRKVIDDILALVQGQLKDGNLLPAIINNTALRIEVCVILSLTNIMIKKIKNGDVLQKHIKLSKTDWLRAITTGMFRGIFCKRKSLSAKVKHEQ